MGAPSTWAGYSGDCPSSLLPDGVPLPVSGTEDPTVYISAGGGVHLPECDINTMEGKKNICVPQAELCETCSFRMSCFCL